MALQEDVFKVPESVPVICNKVLPENIPMEKQATSEQGH